MGMLKIVSLGLILKGSMIEVEIKTHSLGPLLEDMPIELQRRNSLLMELLRKWMLMMGRINFTAVQEASIGKYGIHLWSKMVFNSLT
jgi:hypothetical protein